MSPVTPGASTTTSPHRARDDAPDPRVVPDVAPAGPRPAASDDDTPPDGRSTRWADHREARRAELVRVARRTVHHRGPDVSMEEIAAAAGTSKSIVYRYFSDKTGLQIAVAEAVVLQIRGALEGVLLVAPTPRDGLRAMVAVYLEMIESSPHVYAFVTRDGSVESGGPLGHFLDSVTALVAAPFARGLTEDRDGPRAARRPGADGGAPDARTPDDRPDPATVALAESWAAGAVGFVRGAGEWWLAHRGEPGTPDREALTAQVAAWLWAGPVGLLAREHPRPPQTTPAHPADQQPTGGDGAAPTPREQR
ncbi:TetR/AcrR family transcriptional regulator [Cellulomonas dongxiuzhuiae]|uniref:TetR/AcrR family transcriptional regulator n=1 Tax=Cellulomonas dongxiuzhuiae TaxID=2819979 RepID=A0ABX8GJ13_9CELL|nr:TetR/AcrR family transcriptional regulator [Cellulomonas dongxiuzhuiae]MBO3088161.1 TetR family transcriptional regulator [Cellulomonas dongxiuzhuiae]MBO3094492.1 TetR family transcriptional regulator [Cellulomonas dongxiuzhuiae]QWC15516.1 TetR/AcrR family transcriptional regulator [Cellulomonas dongxiuzhuiae]